MKKEYEIPNIYIITFENITETMLTTSSNSLGNPSNKLLEIEDYLE